MRSSPPSPPPVARPSPSRGDVSKAADAQGIIDAAIKNFGRLDILVNNSGVYEFSPIEAFTEEHFHKIFNVNVLGLLLTTQAAVKHLGEGASIINIGSVVSSLTPPNSAVYTGTKGAVDAITGVLAKELGAQQDPRQLHQPRHGRDRRRTRRGLHRLRLREGSRRADPARPHRSGR